MLRDLNTQAIDIFLQPGEWHVGDRGTRIRTILGSCVSLVLWHPQRSIGGMCHYMLPSRPDGTAKELDGRYADEAMELMLRDLHRTGTRVADYQAKIFGGANMFPGKIASTGIQIGVRNIQAAHHIVHSRNLNCVTEHTAGVGHRNLIFDVATGCVWVKQLNPATIERLNGAPASLPESNNSIFAGRPSAPAYCHA